MLTIPNVGILLGVPGDSSPSCTCEPLEQLQTDKLKQVKCKIKLTSRWSKTSELCFLTWTSSGCMAPILACLPLCGNNWYLHAFIRFQSRSQRPHPVTDAAGDHTWRTHAQEEPEKIASLQRRLAKRTDLTCSFQHLTIAVLELLWKHWNLGIMTLCKYCKSLI